MPTKNKKINSIDLTTLNQLPIAVILFDDKKVYFLNSLAIKLFKVPKHYHLNFEALTIYDFLKEPYQKTIKKDAIKILKGETFSAKELEFKDFKNQPIFVKSFSNLIAFNNKKVIQSTFLEIGEHIKQKAESDKSNQLLSNISNNLNEIIFEIGFIPKMHVKFISESVEKILGIKALEIYKNPNYLKKFVHKNDKKYNVNSAQEYTTILNQQKSNIVNIRFNHKNGKALCLQATADPIFNNKKQIVGLLGNIRDITDDEEIRLLLQETKQKFDLITQNANDVISFYTYYPVEKYLYVSPNIKKMLGYDASQLLKDNNFFTKRTFEYLSEFNKIDLELKTNQRKNIIKNNLYVFRTVKNNNEEIWIENNLTPILNKNGKIAFYLNIYRDITKQKQKEKELELQKTNYQQLLNNLPLAYLILNKGVCVYCNKALLTLLKLKNTKQIIGKFAADFVAPRQRKRILQRIEEVYQEKNLNVPNNYFIIDAAKNEVEVEITSTLINYNDERCIVSLVNNISLQKDQERQKLTIEITENNNKLLQQEIKQREKIQQSLIEKTAQLTAIFNSTNHLIWTVNKKYEFTSYNLNYYNKIKTRYNIKLKLGMCLNEYITNTQLKNEYSSFWNPKYDQAFEGNKLEFVREILDENKQNEKIYRRIFINPIHDSSNQIIEISCIAHDITETKNYEKQLISQSAKLNAIFESGSQAMWTINKNRQITSHNKNYEMAVFNLHNAKPIIGKSLYDDEVGLKSNLDVYALLWDKHYAIAFTGQSTEFITQRTNKNGTNVIRQVYLQPIINQNKTVDEVSGIAHDITDKKISEQKLLNQAAKLNSIFDSSHHYIWTIDTQQKLTSFNKNYFDLIANLYNTQPYIGLSLNRGILSSDTKYNELLTHHYKNAFLGYNTGFEIEVLDKNYNKLFLEVFLNPILNNNEVTEVSGIAHDITDKKLAQQKVEQSLQEKEILLKEVHHRVKNNMQVISSILNLQSSYVSDEYALTLLKESQNRIKTMAYIHESLYQNKSFTSVNFSEYLETLTKNIIQSYAINYEKIELVLNLQKTILNLDSSIPAGLIVNELVTNAIKHAFLPTKKGIITINLTTENNIVFLEIKDNGQGFADTVDFKNSPSLGLQLVNTLIDQIDGELDFETEFEKGTKIIITFKM